MIATTDGDWFAATEDGEVNEDAHLRLVGRGSSSWNTNTPFAAFTDTLKYCLAGAVEYTVDAGA